MSLISLIVIVFPRAMSSANNLVDLFDLTLAGRSSSCYNNNRAIVPGPGPLESNRLEFSGLWKTEARASGL